MEDRQLEKVKNLVDDLGWDYLIFHNGIFVDLKGVIPRKLNCFRL